ncbi:MAG: hypothetical protein FWF90_16225 [Promicromonosporaceae bacterium]|nr:hypothetical protein [Promicromonosporaceae bacterium]
MISPDPEWVDLRNQILQLDTEGTPDPDQRAQLEQELFDRYVAIQRGGTTSGGLPYPDPLDPAAEGADAIRALAEAVGARIPLKEAGGTYVVPAGGTPAVTFPAGMFTVPPLLQVTSITTDANVTTLRITGLTASGFTAQIYNLAGIRVAGNVIWYARNYPGQPA